MKTIEEFLSYLRSLDVKLWCEKDRLRYSSPKGALTEELRAQLRERKAEILGFLHKDNLVLYSTFKSIQAVSRERELPLSFAQQRLWFLDQLEPGSAAYNMPAAVRLTGTLDIAALDQSLNEIVRRHEALRTTFSTMNKVPVQVVFPSLTVPLPVVNLQQLPEVEQSAEVRRLSAEEAQRPFDLANGPLLRVTLLRLAKESHVLLVTMHHIISDGWSVGILIREIATLYQAFSIGYPSPLAELPIQYADYAHWQRQWLQGEVLEAQLTYWKQQLTGAPTVLQLPTDRPRPPVQTFRGARQSLVLSKKLTAALKTLSRQEGVTLFMTLLSAFKILLYQYTGQSEVVVGSPIANRNRSGTEDLIGFFVNALVLRINLSDNLSFRELLVRVRDITLEAYTYQDLPFEQLVEALQPERNLSHQPLFQVMFTLESASERAVELPGLNLSVLEVESATAKFDLTLSMQEAEQGLIGSLEYKTDLFDAATITRMLGHLQTLLEGIVVNPEQQLSDIPLLTQVERHQLLVEWNDTKTVYPQEQSIHGLFEAQVEQTPDAVAVVFEAQQLTYQELNARANQLAHYLRSLEVGPEVLVGICMERSLEMLVVLLAILKAGGAYVPLDLTYPQERLAFMLEDAQVPVLLTQQPLAEKLPQHRAKVVCIDTDWEAIDKESEKNPKSGVTADNLAYVMYTSGSTGRPKGVSIIHQGVVRLVKGANYANLIPEEVFLQLAPISFDASTFEIWGCLLNGARLVISPPHTPSLAELGQAIQQYQITTLWLTAGLFHLMVDERLEDLKPLRQLLAGGDVLSVPHVQKFLQEIGDCKLINGYGPTENTTFTCCYSITELDQIANSVPIGRPTANTQVYVLDNHLQPVPIGIPGELCIGGDGLARGYLNRPELTEEKFIPNPFSNEPGARLYKTGDLARYLPDGNIEFLGRIDSQVKIRGFRIELGEIEAVLIQHPEVREAVVVAREEVPGDKHLVAYVVSNQQHAPITFELRRFLRQKLPEYIIPAAFVLLAELPLTPNGKVDYQALPVPDKPRPDLQAAFMPARTPTEEILSGIWAQILGLEQVGVYDNFFNLGGHSLLATQLITRIQEVFQVELPLRHLFEEPTIASLAQRIERYCQTMAGMRPPAVEAVLRYKNLPLSLIQQRVWLLVQLNPTTPSFNIAAAYHITGTLNITALEQSLNEIVRRHEALRTAFTIMDGQPVQLILPALTLILSLINLQTLSETEQEVELQRLANDQAQQPFDLVQGPLFQVALLKMGQKEHVMLLTVHHIVFDGWSANVFLREVGVLYKAFSTGVPSPLAELRVQYADFAVWQRRWLQGEVLESHLAYWKHQLNWGDFPRLVLPTDRPRPILKAPRGASHSINLGSSLTKMVQNFSRREGVTLFMTLLTVFKTLLHCYTRYNEIVIGSATANRSSEETEALIGVFVNILILRTDLSGNPSFRELLGRVRETVVGAYVHQGIPSWLLLEAVQLEKNKNMDNVPLLPVKFTLQNFLMPTELKRSDLKVSYIHSHHELSGSELNVIATQNTDGLSVLLTYDLDLFNASTIVRMANNFKLLLGIVMTEPEAQISDLLGRARSIPTASSS